MQILPDLFPSAFWEPAAPGAAMLNSPLGALTTQATLGTQPLMSALAESFTHPGGARLWIWRNESVSVELLLAVPELALPAGMHVDGCHAFMWRLRAATSCDAELRCTWLSLPDGAAGAPESGENLAAQAWQEAGHRVLVGTHDRGEATEYLPDGFRVRVSLAPAEILGVHFVAAWSPDRAGDDAAWFAVDCTPSQILASVGAPAS